MSGQTFATTIRIPTPRELAAIVAAEAKTQGVATGSADVSAQKLTTAGKLRTVGQLRTQTMRAALAAASPVAVAVPGSDRDCGESGAEVEVVVNGARVPLQIEVDPVGKQRAVVRMNFTDSFGLTCDGEAATAAEVVAYLAAAGLDPDRPTVQAAAGAAAPGQHAERRAH